MILEGNFILIQSEMNEWIDFAINILDYRKYLDAKQIVDWAYTEWFESDISETIAEYISRKLNENCIGNEIYFKKSEV